MEFTQLIAQRYSCKNFGAGKVDAAALHTILEAGRLAPTAKNTQEQRIYVIQSEEGLAKIDAATPCRYGAPVCLVVAYDKDHTFTYPGERMNSGMEDAAIVATHLMLAAANAGVDSCWLNFFDPDELAKELGLPENEEVLMILDLGYAAEGAGPTGKPRLKESPCPRRSHTCNNQKTLGDASGCFCVIVRRCASVRACCDRWSRRRRYTSGRAQAGRRARSARR